MKRLLTAWRFCWRLVTSFVDCGGLQHAGTISFFALLSILPFAIITVGLVANFVSLSPIEAGPTSPVQEVLNPLKDALPFMDGTLHDLVSELARTRMSLSIVSMLLLLYAASAVFTAISDGVNAMLRTERVRHYALTKLIVSGFVISIAAVIFVWQLARHFIERWAAVLDLDLPPWLHMAEAIELGAKLLVLGVGFYLLVKFTATERYGRRYRWVGAGIFVVVFELAQRGLAVWFGQVVSYERYYGAAAAFFGLSIWLYVLSILFLGACVLIRVQHEFVTGELSPDPDGQPTPE